MPNRKQSRGGFIRKVSKKSSIKTSKKASKKASKKPKTEDEKVYDYISKLKAYIEDKKLDHFVTFSDVGFKGRKYTTIPDMKKIMEKNPEKYVGRTMIRVALSIRLPGEHKLEAAKGILIACDIFTAKIDKEGKINKKSIAQVNVMWEKKHLKISKFSVKLIEKLTDEIIKNKLSFVLVFGTPLNKLLNFLERKKVDVSKYLEPLKL